MFWDAYLKFDTARFEKEVKTHGKNDQELMRLIDFAIRDGHIWAIQIYETYHNNWMWLSHAFNLAARTGSLASIKHLEKNPEFDDYCAELAIPVSAQFKRIRVLKYLLDNYRVRSAKELFSYGLYFTSPETHTTILQHPKVIAHIYKPYKNDNYSYENMVTKILEKEKARRRERNQRLLLLYVFLTRWAREVKARPGNSDYMAAMEHFYSMVRKTSPGTCDSQSHFGSVASE